MPAPCSCISPATMAEAAQYGVLFKQHEACLYGPARDHLNKRLAEIGIRRLTLHALDANIVLPDAFLQLTAPCFAHTRLTRPLGLPR